MVSIFHVLKLLLVSNEGNLHIHRTQPAESSMKQLSQVSKHWNIPRSPFPFIDSLVPFLPCSHELARGNIFNKIWPLLLKGEENQPSIRDLKTRSLERPKEYQIDKRKHTKWGQWKNNAIVHCSATLCLATQKRLKYIQGICSSWDWLTLFILHFIVKET